MPATKRAVDNPAMDRGFVLCPYCGDRIGVYEPTIAITPYGARRTSVAREPLLKASDTILLHPVCYGTEPYERGENG